MLQGLTRFGLPLLGKELLEQAARKRTYVVRVLYATLLFCASFLFFYDTLRTGAYPISARPFGLPRNPFFSPPITDVDLRVMKTFPVRNNRAVLQVGIEAFNLANHTNPARVSQIYAAGGQRLGSYGQSIETLNARQLQFMIQFEY